MRSKSEGWLGPYIVRVQTGLHPRRVTGVERAASGTRRLVSQEKKLRAISAEATRITTENRALLVAAAHHQESPR